MTEEDRVPQRVTQAYRELGAPNPPDALDEAILAASRRPPVFSAKTWTQRWAVPLSLAAVLVLSVTVTLRLQHEQPGIESPVPQEKEPMPAGPAASVKDPAQASPAPAEDSRRKLKVEQQSKAAGGAPARERPAKPGLRDEPKPFPEPLREQAPPAAAPAPARAPAPATAAPAAPSRADMARGAESGALAKRAETRAEMRAELGAAAKPATESPERELERIAQLRREGRHEEADKALVEFRKRHPDYKIPEKTLERVERR